MFVVAIFNETETYWVDIKILFSFISLQRINESECLFIGYSLYKRTVPHRHLDEFGLLKNNANIWKMKKWM